MPTFGDAERRILSYFTEGSKFLYKNQDYKVLKSGKPTCQSGEPKTDIYILAESTNGKEEIKISYKKENADFLENKINSLRAEQLFGSDWRFIIESSTKSISNKFLERALIYKEAYGKTEEGAITLGWKFEFVNKPSGDLSGRMALTAEQVYDVYAGTNLDEDKRNAYVNGNKVQSSGIANNILVSDCVNSSQEVINQMIPIEEYIKVHPDIYFACKALNYRTFKQKYDGDRPLSVQVDWEVKEGKLTPYIVFNAPLERNGKEMAKKLLNCMKLLDIHTTDDISASNADMNNVHK